MGRSYWQVLAGRAISGIGGAGMVGLVAVVIAGKDSMVPVIPPSMAITSEW